MSLSTAYDPQEPEDQPKSSLLSRKDAIRIFVGVFFLAILLLPVWFRLMDDRNKYLCRTHLGEVMKAMLLYSEINTDRFPPAYAMQPDGQPIMSGDRANTWVSVVSSMMNKPAAEFTCPAAHDSEEVRNAGGEGKTIVSHFGIFGAMATMARSNVANPSQTVLIAESSNRGSMNTFDPMPLPGTAPDGFLIGFNNTNFLPGEPYSVFKSSTTATRLAFRKTKDGNFDGVSDGRHGEHIHVLFVDGHIENLKSHGAKIKRQGEELWGAWSVR